MTRPRTYKTEGVVLRHITTGEADRILTFFTQDMGKVRAIAKGVRRSKSKLSGHLELLNRVSLSIAQGRSLDIVSEAQLIDGYPTLRTDLERLSRAVFIAELVDSFTVEHSAGPAIYRLLLDTLTLMETSVRPETLLRFFEMHLLDRSGYRPELHTCVECQETLEPVDHLFSNAHGGALCPRCRLEAREAMAPVPVRAMKVLRFLQREEISAASSLNVGASTVREVGRVLHSYLRYILERELKSAAFMDLVTARRPGET